MKKAIKITLLLAALILFNGILYMAYSGKVPLFDDNLTQTTMKITSSAFQHNENIPAKYTCNGENINPPLEISELPEGTRSIAMIVDDPDAPAGTWAHWTVWNMPAGSTVIPENSRPEGIEGTTSFGNTGYGGPCPPSGTHRYFFKAYALDTTVSLDASASAEDLQNAMQGHVLENVELIGLYSQES